MLRRYAIDEGLARDRFAESIARIRGILPQSEVVVLSPASISFRRHGLEFAQARIAHDPRNFQSTEEIAFGVGPEERVLNAANETQFGDLVRLAAAVRHQDGPKNHALWRMHPERWFESLVVRNIAALDGRLRLESVYAQVPAFAAADRAMIDILAVTRESRLAVIELKADEDIHLPLQGVDYWSRCLAPEPWRVCQIRIFPWTRNLATEASSHAGRARSACPSHNRHDPALSVTGDRLGTAGD